VLSETPAPLDKAAPGLPAKLNEVVMRALAKDPDMRYATALDMANELIAIRAAIDASPASLGTLSLRATIESALEGRRTREFERVRRRRVGLAGIGIAAAASLILVGWLLARRSARDSGSSSDVAIRSAPPAVTPSLAGSPATAVTEQPVAPANPSSTPPQSVNRSTTTPTNSGTNRVTERAGDRQRTSRPAAPAQEARAQDQRVAPVTPPATPPPPANPVVIQQPTTNVAVPDARPIAAPTPNAASAAAEIGGVIEAYARAIESRDMAELRRVYAAITPDQVRAFTDFFSSTRTLRATLAVKSVQVDGANATAHVSGSYEFTTNAGRTQQQPVSFQTELHRDGSGWKLVSVR